MNVEFSAEDLAFQAEVKAFIDENLTPDMREVLQRSPTGHLSKTLQIEWQQRLAKKGWAVPNWPAEWGGPSWNHAEVHL
jgi:alkylation response protein AidB-like acyl-CoA dehydrogenase